MEICAQFPTRTIGNDPAKIKDWAQAAEDLGYSYIEVPDHVFGASPRDGWTPTYAADEDFHETFVTTWLPGGLHQHHPPFQRRADPAPAANRRCREAGGGNGFAFRRAFAPRHWRWLEPCGV